MPKENVSPRRCLYSWRSASPRAPSLFRALQTLRPSNAASENSMRSSNVVLARDAKVTIVQTEERASRKLQLSCVFPFCGTTTVSVTFHPWSKMLHLLGKEQGKLKKISDDLTSERAITKKNTKNLVLSKIRSRAAVCSIWDFSSQSSNQLRSFHSAATWALTPLLRSWMHVYRIFKRERTRCLKCTPV